MSVSTERQRKVRTQYCNLMYEVRNRIDFLLRMKDKACDLPTQPAFELGYLQLRMICETIALACLLVQGENPGARSATIRSAHEADKILRALETLNPDFYPQPGAPIPHGPTGGRAFVPSDKNYLTKSELLRLYWRCGDFLHRGNYEAAQNPLPEADFSPIFEATLKFVELLKFHKISFLGSEDEMWVTMESPKTGKVGATLERPFRL